VKAARTFQVLTAFLFFALSFGVRSFAQAPDGPQTDAQPSATSPKPAAPRTPGAVETIIVPAGTRFGVILENGVSTRGAKPGDSVYMRTSFPITQNNRVVIPVGSYIRGEILESKRPGRVKGKGELRLKLNTLVLPNGYTIDLNAAPRSADTGGKETMDSEGKMSSPGGKGTDVPTVVRTTAETVGVGTGVGAITGGAKGAGIGAGIGGAVALTAFMLTRGPDAQLPRGSTLDIELEHDLALDKSQIQYSNLGQPEPINPMPVR